MLNFVKIAKQLDQDALPIFCDKGVFRILVIIYLQRKDQYQILIQMLGGFHAVKCVEYCIGKYIQGSRIEGHVNVVDTVLNGINYKGSFKGCLILANAIEKWDAFLKITDINQFYRFSDAIKSLQIAFTSKTFENSKLSYEICSS